MVSFLSSAYAVLFFQRFPVCSAGEEPACSAGDTGEVGSIPGLRRPPWGVKRQTAPVSLPGASHGHGSLVDHSPEGRRVRQPEWPHTGQPRVTLSLKSYCYIHICVFSTLCNLKHVRLSAVCFLFFSLLLSQLSVVQKQMTPKLSHLKNYCLLVLGVEWAQVIFLCDGGGSVLGLASPQHVWELSSGCRPEYLPMACLLVWVPQQHVAGFKHECPQDTRQRLGGFLWPTPRISQR